MPGAKFCTNCGVPIVEPKDGSSSSATAGAVPAPPAESDHAAERRQLTVLFCDLVGSTAISERLDPEDYRALIATYREAASAAVRRYDGHVANYVGDGIVAFFGYPVVQEGSAYAAALCALELVELAPKIAGEFQDPEISTEVRVGLHTGPVIVGETRAGDHIEKRSLFGDVPNVASRIQSIGKPGQIITSAVTRRLIGPQLAFDSLGHKTLAGIREPMALFRVNRPGSAFEGVRQVSSDRTVPLIGRKAEIALVETRWEAAVEGDGQVMVVTGEAGIGKSRIAFSLGQRLAQSEANRILLFGSPIRKNSAFYSLKASLGMLLGISEVDQAAEKRRKVDGFVAALGVDDGTVASPIAGLFGVADDVSTQMTASPERQKLEIINALLKLCVAMSAKRPLLMILDDAHWIDPSTLEFVSRWIDALPGRRCLTLITARPEFVSPWKNLPHVTGLELNRLGKRETIALIEKIAGTSLPAPLLEQIVSRTDGVPLFIEELTKMIVEAGFLAEGVDFRGDLSLAIPDSLQDSLMARLDRLASVKEVAQVAAAIGRNFTLEVLARVQGRSDREVEDALSKLVDADLIVPMGGIVEKQSYRFRHALVQDAAYQSMLRSSRTAWHGRIASVLERDFPEEAEREPELLGHHFLLAGNHESAERYWLAAARMAIGRSANVEAIEHLNHALESLRRTPPSADRDRREMDLQIMIAVPLAFVNGYAHASVRTTYDRARDLCRQYGEMERLFKVVYGQFRSALLAGEYAVALKNVDHLGSLLSELNDPLLVAAIERSRGAVLTYLGRPEEAVQHLYKGAEAELTIDDRVRGLDFDVVDLKVALNGYLALSNWLRGRTSEAIEAIGNAVEHSRETDHPFSVSFALAFATWVYQFIGDEKAVQDYSARLIALSEENTFQFWMGWGRVMNGWARRAELGEKALTVIGQGLDEWRGTGSLLGLSYFLSLYASTAISLGRTDEAESLIAEAVAFEDDSGEAFWRPELIRLRAEAALAQSKYREGKEFLREAIACASKMGLHGPQIRAATALARLASDPDDQLEADAALGAALSKIAKDDPAAEEAMQVRQTLTVRRIG